MIRPDGAAALFAEQLHRRVDRRGVPGEGIRHVTEGRVVFDIGKVQVSLYERQWDRGKPLPRRCHCQGNIQLIEETELLFPDSRVVQVLDQRIHRRGGMVVHQYSLTGELIRGDALTLRQRVRLPKREAGLLPKQLEGGQSVPSVKLRGLEKGNIQRPDLKIVSQFLPLLLHHDHVNFRMAVGKIRNEAVNTGPVDKSVKADCQPQLAVSAGKGIVNKLSIAVQDPGKPGLQDSSGLGQSDSSVVSFKQRNLKLPLQFADLEGYGRLRDAHFLCRLCHASGFSRREKALDPVKIHTLSLSCRSPDDMMIVPESRPG